MGSGDASLKATSVPLVVDLDGTLIRGDLLFEALLPFAKRGFHRVQQLILWLLGGKASFKTNLAARFDPDPRYLPYEPEVLKLIDAARQAGRPVVLSTASPARWAQGIATHLGVFDEVMATRDGVNLAGATKRAALVDRFGEGGFDYVGNSHADVPVLAAAHTGYLVRPSKGVLRSAQRSNQRTTLLVARNHGVEPWLRSLRVHQWAKNLLVFVPLLAAHRLEFASLAVVGIAFVAFSSIASSVYLLNDVLDIHHDRKHPTKRHRSIPAGRVAIPEAILVAALLAIVGLSLSATLLPVSFVVVLVTYLLMTLAYSLLLKEVALVDVLTLGLLYTLRVVAGATALLLPLTPWLLAFSMFTFLSLAIVKRYAEMTAGDGISGNVPLAGLGYVASDASLVLSLGTASAYASVLVLALYIQDPSTHNLYSNPLLIWFAVPAWLYWFNRVWLITHRKAMHDDPVVFAIKDPITYLVGITITVAFVAAI